MLYFKPSAVSRYYCGNYGVAGGGFLELFSDALEALDVLDSLDFLDVLDSLDILDVLDSLDILDSLEILARQMSIFFTKIRAAQGA